MSFKQIKQLMQRGEFLSAHEQSVKALDKTPTDPELWYTKAVCERYLSNISDAQKSLSKLIELQPDYSRAYQEQGHCFRAGGNLPLALQAYERAVAINPALLASWQQIKAIATQLHNSTAIKQAEHNLQHYGAMPAPLVAINSMLFESKLDDAEKLCRSFLLQAPKDPEAMRLLAAIGVKRNILDDAEFVLESCYEFNPHYQPATIDYIYVLNKRQKYSKAYRLAKQLLNKQPNNPVFQSTFADQAAGLNKIEQAVEYYLKAIKQLPEAEGLYLMLGHAYKTAGQSADAVAQYQKAKSIRPTFGDAYWSLANLKTYRFTDEDIALLQDRLDHHQLSLIDRFHMEFALGKAMEDRKRYDDAFVHYKNGNSLKRSTINYSAKGKQQEFEQQKAFFTSERIETLNVSKEERNDPIFIVGLPRSGSTLIEQILASHSAIEGTMELSNILATAYRLNKRAKREQQPNYPEILSTLSTDELTELGQDYLEQTKVHRAKGTPYFIDKMPNNFQHIGLIKTILPNAKIIDARRDPMGCCFSGFKQLFAEGQDFSYDQQDIAYYYNGYLDLMAHWKSLYPESIITLDYQDSVEDLAKQVDKVLDFLGLPFEDACVEFYKTKRSVRTASAEQVRQPINNKALYHWQHFSAQLKPMQDLLETGSLASNS